ncbi:hypothetical protein FFLO_06994 [Filobasidium floriforme]|uniref:Uncharacterized protein n=1 Tax=Filobasidium floriforme TaxID=5210 RepID=A0A8K0JE61_9TREE|nr:hypothetical protein FFLO_06994 [Filobasidium floriforme]
MHYAECVALYGPLTGFATWALERNNGELSRVNHNGQERDVPTTLMRAWLLEARLCAILSNPAPDADLRELQALMSLLTSKEPPRGTLMMEEMRSVAANWHIRLPVPYQRALLVDLRQHDAYQPLLAFVQRHHPEHGFVDAADYLDDRPCLPHRSGGYHLYTHATYNGFKFCSMLWSRSRRDQFALAETGEGQTRDLCKIHLLLRVDSIDATLALVEFYLPAQGDYPWQTRSIDLGMKIYRNQTLGKVFIRLEQLKASTIVSRVETMQDGDCLVSFSCDRVSHAYFPTALIFIVLIIRSCAGWPGPRILAVGRR